MALQMIVPVSKGTGRWRPSISVRRRGTYAVSKHLGGEDRFASYALRDSLLTLRITGVLGSGVDAKVGVTPSFVTGGH
jgi:hypothetical protein